MRMILIHCSGSADLCHRRPPLLGQLAMRCAAQHALVVEHVALALDERVFGRVARHLAPLVAQLVIRCDAQHALLVEHVALMLDMCVFGCVAQLVIPCNAQHALCVEHVALALDVRCFGRVAVPHAFQAPLKPMPVTKSHLSTPFASIHGPMLLISLNL